MSPLMTWMKQCWPPETFGFKPQLNMMRNGSLSLTAVQKANLGSLSAHDDEMFLNTLLHTKDSAPGPDGLPYSAWRLLPKVTVDAMALLADLSKAFERVNPYWILELLRIRRAPRWLYAYAKFVLFQRRVSHKVQGRLLPSRTIRQGVDMGRSFSVYLFCLAMDPLFTYLNRIPGVISVRADQL